MNDTIAFDRAKPDDAGSLLRLVEEYYAEAAYPFEERAVRAALAGLLEDRSRGRIWVIRDARGAVGYLVVTFGWSLEHGGRDAFVDELFLRPRHRGRGIGGRALDLAEAACREHGVQALHLEVEQDNAPARALYRRHGFRGNRRALLSKRLGEAKAPGLC